MVYIFTVQRRSTDMCCYIKFKREKYLIPGEKKKCFGKDEFSYFMLAKPFLPRAMSADKETLYHHKG